jgi:subtilase family serine protease
MTGRFRGVLILLALVAFVLTLNLVSFAGNTRELITQKVDDHQLITLAGNTRPEISATNDRGEVNPDLQLNHMLLLLQRSPEQEKELEQFIEEQHNPKSALFHHWIHAAEFGQRFGLAQSDIDKITSWLESYGLKVEYVYQNRMLIDYSGTASQIENAFNIQLRNYLINGELRMANDSDPKIPAALAKAVVGPLYLNNFHPQAMYEKLHDAHISPTAGGTMQPDYTAGGELPLVPYDLEKIYNIAPLYPAGITGTGMTVMLVEDTNQWNCLPGNPGVPAGGGYNICAATSDWAVFRNSFGLPRFGSPVFKENNPGPTTSTNCNAPSTGRGYPSGSGINSDDVEASIDVQWATAAAPNATIVNAACADPSGGFGGLTAIQNTLNHPNADGVDVISMSYGEPETTSGAALNASFNTTFQQAVTAGLGIFVSSGDSLAAADDRNRASATHGIQISGWMSSPYDVSVGGLDFADTYLGENSTYWNTTNNVFYGSAKSYIMEQPWNDDCAGTLLAHYLTGSYVTYGSTGFCNTSTGSSFLEVAGGSGGPSNCATGTPATRGLVGGTCAGWAKPTYQSNYIGTMAGLVNDNVRDTPDVALMAANGLWGHYYVLCYTDTTSSGISNGGIASCTAVPPIDWPGYGGTSISSPIMAAIQALVVQHKGSLQGNPNTRYYALANTEYGPSGNASCDSTLGNGVGSSCVFYDVTMGDIDTDCTALSGTLHNCYKPSGTYGVLSTNNSAYDPAYPTGPDAPFGSYPAGWDFSSGIGSVNAYNLVMAY